MQAREISSVLCFTCKVSLNVPQQMKYDIVITTNKGSNNDKNTDVAF